jgi:hypothetical protein
MTRRKITAVNISEQNGSYWVDIFVGLGIRRRMVEFRTRRAAEEYAAKYHNGDWTN